MPSSAPKAALSQGKYGEYVIWAVQGLTSMREYGRVTLPAEALGALGANAAPPTDSVPASRCPGGQPLQSAFPPYLASMPVSHRHPSNARPVEAVPSDRLPGLFGKGRQCSFDGCITVLNQWHPGHRCYVHEAPRFIRGSGSREQLASVEDFRELLEEVA